MAVTPPVDPATVLVIGGGPAGLMAAEVLARAGVAVDLCEAMPSVGRKFLLAGKGGLNLTHSEPAAAFRQRYAEGGPALQAALTAFGADQVRAWAADLGIETFVGSSGRVFPRDLKAAPLLRAWLHRLRAQGVRFHTRHRWLGWDAAAPTDDRLAMRFATPDGPITARARAVVLALGGGSWPQLGSDAAWVPLLTAAGVTVTPLQASNCGYLVSWSPWLRDHHAGTPLKNVRARVAGPTTTGTWRAGEMLVADYGLEGGLIYALSAELRAACQTRGCATLHIDLLPDHSHAAVLAALQRPRGSRSLSSHLASQLGLKGVKAALLRESLTTDDLADLARLAAGLKTLPVTVTGPRPLAEAISTAGGVARASLDEHGMLQAYPGVFCAGEMLDWDAPTGGYLLTASLATGVTAAQGVLAWLNHPRALRAGASIGVPQNSAS